MIPSNPSVKGAIQSMQEHPEWVHQLAYNLWAFTCSQKLTRVADLLNAGTYQDDGGIVPDDAYEDGQLPAITITRQAIGQWKSRENWDDRRIRDMRDLAPSVHQKVASNLMTASQAAEEFLAQLARGEIVAKDAIEAKMIDARMKASQDILNRAGHMPHTRPSDGTALPGPKTDHFKSIAGKSREERLAMAWKGVPRDDGVIDVDSPA